MTSQALTTTTSKQVGQPTKLTPERHNAIVTALAAGNTRTTAVSYARVSYQTFLNWLERGESGKRGPYVEFFEAVKKAEADAAVASVTIIRQAARENWQAAAWWLERRFPNDWGRAVPQDNRAMREIIIREYGGFNPEAVE